MSPSGAQGRAATPYQPPMHHGDSSEEVMNSGDNKNVSGGRGGRGGRGGGGGGGGGDGGGGGGGVRYDPKPFQHGGYDVRQQLAASAAAAAVDEEEAGAAETDHLEDYHHGGDMMQYGHAPSRGSQAHLSSPAGPSSLPPSLSHAHPHAHAHTQAQGLPPHQSSSSPGPSAWFGPSSLGGGGGHAHPHPHPHGHGHGPSHGLDYVASFSDDDVDELEARLSRFSNTANTRYETHSRSKSLMRYNEIERERTKRRQNVVKQKTGSRCFPGTLKLSMMNAGVISLKKAEKDALTTAFYEKPVSVGDFQKHCTQRRKYPVLLQIEFNNALKEKEMHTTRHGVRRNNQEKNQNPRIIPYDYNRVVLESEEGVPDSDYINASYVDSLVQPKAYIVTQGPTETTIGDFWRMVWQEKASCIVMVTRTFDFIRVMCVQYWPAGKNREEVYSGVGVTVENEEQLANFMIRTIRLRKNDTEERTVILFHYTEWNCHSNPFSNALLEFRRRVRNVMNHHPDTQDGPVIVHCNDGAGRSGVYIAIDANIELSEEDGVFDAFGYLKKMRQQRRGLIESIDQYRFVYETISEYLNGIDSRFPIRELANKIKERGIKDKKTKKNSYQLEYSLITNQTPRFTIGDCAAGHRADNRDKNRNVLIVPPDNFRPYITSFQGNNCTDYINAVFVDGYTHPREYIVTEWPLHTTCSDIWSLVYDHDCSALVVLCNPTSGVSNAYPSFWPENTRSKKYGQVFTVEHMAHSHSPNIRSWVFRINKKIVSLTELMAGVKAPSKTCQLFQLMCWPQGHKVPTSTNALVELMNMVERWRQKTDYGPVVVVSQDGQSRAGVYCAANACIEQVIQHGEVDVFQACKTVRRHRPQLVENITEYKYCYDLVLHYVLHYLHKDGHDDDDDNV